MREFKCKDAGHACEWKVRGDDDKDIINQARDHGQKEHALKDVKDDQIRPLIHDVA